MIDASKIYTPQRAQNIMSDSDVQRVYDLYKSYQDKIDYVKVVTIADIEKADYTLAVRNYIENKKQETIPPEEIMEQYDLTLKQVRESEEYLRELLTEGGYINEQ